MNIIFNKITIENFKGCIGKREIVFNPCKTMILGANHSGKTTTADAAHWVLFGKNIEGKSDFGITPKDENGELILHLDNSVTLDMTADGRDYSIQRVRKEKWTKPRGQVDEVLSGYTTYYFINGEKYTEKDYKAFIEGLISESLFRAITNPEYFPTLKPESQRALLVKMVGDKSDDEIAAGNPEFEVMLNAINGQNIKAYRQELAYKIKELKKSIDDIPGRISEHQTEVNAIRAENYNFSEIEARIAEIDATVQHNQKKMSDCSLILNEKFAQKANKRKEIADLHNEKYKIEKRYNDENETTRIAYETKIRIAKADISTIKSRIQSEEYSLKVHNQSAEEMERRKANFRKEWQECEAMEFVWDTTKEICPTCGQRLPQDDIEKLEDEARERFNTTKQNKQDNLDRIAKELKAEAERIDAVKRNSEKKIAELKDKLSEAEAKLKRLQDAQTEQIFKDYKDDEDWKSICDSIIQREAELQQLDEKKDNSVNDTMKTLQDENEVLQDESKELVRKLAKKYTIERGEKRIKELTEQQRTLSQQLADLEKQDYTAECFELATIQDLQDRVNGLFGVVKFNMFKTLINGNREPTCELTMHGTPYRDLSNSEKIIAGIDVISAMSRYNGVCAPIIIDNAESINDVPPTDAQQILLIVSRDEQLTVVNEAIM